MKREKERRKVPTEKGNANKTLLALVESVNLVHKENGALAICCKLLATLLQNPLELRDARGHGAHLHKSALGQLSHCSRLNRERKKNEK